MPSPYGNGDARTTPSRFPSTVSQQKFKRFNSLVLVFRLAAFSFSLASSIFMITNNNSGGGGSTSSSSLRWYDFDAFRYVVAGNAVVAIYSLFEMGAAVWEISKDATLFPEVLQVWFDFAHDQVFAYLLISANSTGAALARTLKGRGGGDTCMAYSAFCVQAEISIALGFAGFLFLVLLSLLSGFRVACFMINGSRFLLL